MSLGLGSLANDPDLQKFVAAKELENQLTAQVILIFPRLSPPLIISHSGSSFNQRLFR